MNYTDINIEETSMDHISYNNELKLKIKVTMNSRLIS